MTALLSACQSTDAPPHQSAAGNDVLGPYKQVQAQWNNQFTCTENQWHEWQIPNERFGGIVARAIARNGRFEVQLGNGYYKAVRVTWNATSSTTDTQATQTTTLEPGVSTASPIVTTISSTGSPTPDLFLNVVDVQPCSEGKL
jgi:hypothetical protein